MRDLNTLMDMTGRRTLITGGAGHLGRTMADSLAELRAEVLLVDAPDAPTPRVADDIATCWGVTVTALDCDLEDVDARATLVEQVALGGLSELVNNVAFVGTSGLTKWAEPLERQSVETWRRALEVNLTAGFHLWQLFAPALKAGPGGIIINIASIYGQWGQVYGLYEGTAISNPAAYSASKGGILQFNRWLSTILARQVRANVISPSGVARGQRESFVSRYTERTPLKRMATEEGFRGAVAYLASDLSTTYVIDQVLAVDGGWGAW